MKNEQNLMKSVESRLPEEKDSRRAEQYRRLRASVFQGCSDFASYLREKAGMGEAEAEQFVTERAARDLTNLSAFIK